jgi:hypothetical protein
MHRETLSLPSTKKTPKDDVDDVRPVMCGAIGGCPFL